MIIIFDECDEPRTSTTRVSTFEGYFKIEDRCRSILGMGEESRGTDFWCTARASNHVNGDAVFECRVWFVYVRDIPQPCAYFNVPGPAQRFYLRWQPNVGIELSDFDPEEVLRCTGITSGEDQLRSSQLLRSTPCNTTIIESFDDEGDTMFFPCLNDKTAVMVAWTTELPMFGGENLGDHYFKHVGAETISHVTESAKASMELSTVTEDFVHGDTVDEHPAGNEEAALISHELWATSVEHRINYGATVAEEDSDGNERILVLAFSRCTLALQNAIMESPVARLAAQRGIDVVPPWANGAKVLVDGVGPQHIDAPMAVGALRPWRVIVSESDEAVLMAALQGLPYSIRKIKPSNGRNPVPGKLSLMSVSSEVSEALEDDASVGAAGEDDASVHMVEICVLHTFVHFANSSDTRTIQSA